MKNAQDVLFVVASKHILIVKIKLNFQAFSLHVNFGMHYITLALFTYTSIHVAIHTTHAYVYFHGWAHLWMTECMVARVH